MSTLPLSRITICTTLAAALLAASTLSAFASMRLPARFQPKAVQVSVSFNSQFPLADESEDTVAALQKAGRRMVYAMAGKECDTLRETIARSCKLTSLNVSSQMRQQGNGESALYLNGSARFAITLKDPAQR